MLLDDCAHPPVRTPRVRTPAHTGFAPMWARRNQSVSGRFAKGAKSFAGHPAHERAWGKANLSSLRRAHDACKRTSTSGTPERPPFGCTCAPNAGRTSRLNGQGQGRISISLAGRSNGWGARTPPHPVGGPGPGTGGFPDTTVARTMSIVQIEKRGKNVLPSSSTSGPLGGDGICGADCQSIEGWRTACPTRFKAATCDRCTAMPGRSFTPPKKSPPDGGEEGG